MATFKPRDPVVHAETGEKMTFVAAANGNALVERASGQWTYPLAKLRAEAPLACPIPPRRTAPQA